ncbi:hypothetical protein [Methanobrevibacter sp. DSM 116169]|uniref:hypothetical protein n=1 Tax=Methanobrevibacter sp. DSM 116169 TaxID=3242727 RepID=UPI0038FC5FC9
MNRIAGWLVVNNKEFNKRNIYGYFNRVADRGTIERTTKERYLRGEFVADELIGEYTECAIVDNQNLSFLPLYVTGTNGVKYYTNTFVDMANRVSAYEVLNGKSPAIVYLKKENNTSQNNGTVTTAFKNALGNFDNTIDGALRLIQGRGYAYYYNSSYNTQTTINRIRNKQGVNCTDVSQILYRIAIELGYEAQFVHVYCSKNPNKGHVRLRLRHPVNTEGTWIYRDGASVLSGNGIRSNWCESKYALVGYNPAWIFNDLYQ